VARVIGTPGESAAVRGALSILLTVVLIFVFVLLPALYALVYYATRSGLPGIALAVLAIAGAWWWKRKDLLSASAFIPEGRIFLKGAEGERSVHVALQALSDHYVVFHDFHPKGADGKRVAWNVDHVVVGPSGVFVVDAKNYSSGNVLSAAKSGFTRKNVRQVQRSAMELKDRLVRWSGGELAKLFVVPVVVYTQQGAHVECLREGAVRTIPLNLLRGDIERHSESAIDQQRAGRIARVLFAQLPGDLQLAFRAEMDAYGEHTKAAMYAARDERIAQQQAAPTAPTRCPQCGAHLVRRTARFGPRAGKSFLGCSNFHATGCAYGFNLD
jgi:hypothetical protein